MYQNIYFSFEKTNNQANEKRIIKKEKETIEETIISLENRFKKSCSPPGQGFSRHPHFQKQEFFLFFWTYAESFEKKIIKIKYCRSSLDTENSRYGHQQPYDLFSAFDNFRALTDNSGKPESVDSKQKN